MALLQKRILENVAGLLRKGGRMVYSTCTVYEEENKTTVDGFLEENRDFSLEAGEFGLLDEALFDDRGFFWTVPHRHNMDGFFAARLMRP